RSRAREDQQENRKEKEWPRHINCSSELEPGSGGRGYNPHIKNHLETQWQAQVTSAEVSSCFLCVFARPCRFAGKTRSRKGTKLTQNHREFAFCREPEWSRKGAENAKKTRLVD